MVLNERRINLKKIVLRICILFLSLLCLISVIVAFTEPKERTSALAVFAICGILIFLISIKKIKNSDIQSDIRISEKYDRKFDISLNAKDVTLYDLKVPKDVLDSMKQCNFDIEEIINYIENSISIMQESDDILLICQNYTEGIKKAFHLRQLELAEISKNSSASAYIYEFGEFKNCIKRCYRNTVSNIKNIQKQKIAEAYFWETISVYLDYFSINDLHEELRDEK